MTRQEAFWLADDATFLKQQKNKKKHTPEPLPTDLPEGPCCGKCRNWRAPDDLKDFGICRHLAVVDQRMRMGPEKGTTLTVTEAMSEPELHWDFMTCRHWFSCRGFTPRAKEEAA